MDATTHTHKAVTEDASKSPLRQPFRLLDLPVELWLHICEFTVIEDNTIYVSRGFHKLYQAVSVEQPAITRTCQLLRTEVLPMFYRFNDFKALAYHRVDVEYVGAWLAAIGKQNVREMGVLELAGSMLDIKGLERWLGDMEMHVRIERDGIGARTGRMIFL